MKKVLFVLQGLGNGGVASVVLNYYRSMQDQIKADFVVMVPPNRTPDSLKDELEVKGCNIYHITSFTKNMLRCYSELKEIISKGNYDIVHDNDKYFAFLSLMSARKYKVPIRICHVHNTVAKNEKSLIHRMFITVASKLSVSASNCLMACSEEAGRSMFGSREFHVLNNAIDVDRYQFDASLRERLRSDFGFNHRRVLMMVARRDELKRFDHAFAVFGELFRMNPDYVFAVVGFQKEECLARDRAALSALPKEAQENVMFLGKRIDANALLNMADAFLLTSEHEGFGIAIIEAQANGLPCFISTGVPQAVKVTDLVHFLPCLGAPSEWVNCIQNESQTKERGAYAQEIRNSQFDIQTAAHLLGMIYEI